MKIILKNSISELVIGGIDNLVPSGDLMKELRKYMSIKDPGAFFARKSMNYHWDGMHYFITPKGKFATGFFPYILKYMDSEHPDLLVEIEDTRENIVTLQEDLETTIGDNQMTGKYEHQQHLINVFRNTIQFRGETIDFPRGIVDAATNAGKTTIFGGIYMNAQPGTSKMLLLIDRKTVYTQLVEYFTELLGDVGQINDKNYKIMPVTVAMVQTLSNRVKDDMAIRNDIQGFDILATDECHKAGSATYKRIFKYSNAYMRIFLSGSALDSSDDKSKLLIIGSSGPKLGEVSKVELMNKGVSTKVEVQIHLSNTMLHENIFSYSEFIDFCIYYSLERVSVMGSICDHSKGGVIIAVDKIAHGEFIYNNLSTTKRIEFTHGQDSAQLKKINAFKNGEVDVLIVTSIIREGVNIPNIYDVIYAVGGKSKVSIKQWMGRAERLLEGKDKVVFHDFYDIGKHIRKHSDTRMAVYQEEGLPYFCNFVLKDAKKLSSILVF